MLRYVAFGATVIALAIAGKAIMFGSEPRPSLEAARPLEIYEPVDSLVTMEVTGRKNNILTVTITNSSDYAAMTGFPFEVEFFDGLKWVTVPPVPNGHDFISLGLMLDDSETMTKDIGIFQHVGTGLYRIRKDITVLTDWYGGRAVGRHDIVAEFRRNR